MESSADGAWVRERWDNEELIIMARLSEGPQAGETVASVIARSEFLDGLKKIRKLSRSRTFIRSLKEAVRGQILRGVAGLTPENDAEFMGDLVLVMMLACEKGEAAVEGMGLFSILLAVDPDTTRPWNHRGLLSEEDTSAFMYDNGS